MAGKKITEKIVTKHTVKLEGILNVDSLDENVVLLEVEEIGELDISQFLKKFSDKNVKITIEEASEEIPDLDL